MKYNINDKVEKIGGDMKYVYLLILFLILLLLITNRDSGHFQAFGGWLIAYINYLKYEHLDKQMRNKYISRKSKGDFEKILRGDIYDK